MLQNKYKFNQSSVSLEIVGLPDYSKNDDEKSISIISQWKLSIVNQPDIEGSLDHLKSIVSVFYQYSSSILLEQENKLETKLIDIRSNDDGSHCITLKSSKPKVEPLKINLGNAEFSDVINCLDQLKEAKDINLDFNDSTPNVAFKKIRQFNKKKIFYSSMPLLIAIFSISFLSFLSINFYEDYKVLEEEVSFDINNKN
tara:strand:+ start:944 stop:1540 length:597 start_codon:yes stop_codon:yes gene_type:complete